MPKFYRLSILNRRHHGPLKPDSIIVRAVRSFRFMTLMVVIVTVMAGAGYLLFVNQNATAGFNVKDLELRAEVLRLENRELEVQAAELQSLKTIGAAAEQMGLVSVGHIDYLSGTQSEVALGYGH